MATDEGHDRRALGEFLRIPPGGEVDLASHPAGDTPGAPGRKSRTVEELTTLGKALAGLQERLFAAATAGDRRRLLLILQGMDTSGKGGTVKHVVGFFNPAGCRIRAFKAPSEEERRHHYLWRVSAALPQAGEVGIFDRSHYEDVLVPRVHRLVPEATLDRRYDEINAWERALADDGVAFVKIFLHISPEEQRERLLARLDRPHKHWKFSPADIAERTLWPAYQEAYAAALARCSTEHAPWHLVPADRKWYRNWAVSRLLLERLRELDPHYPPGEFDVAASRERLRSA